MQFFKTRDFGLLVCVAFIIVLFGFALYCVKQQPSDPLAETHSEHTESYQIEIRKEKSFGEVLSGDPVAYYTKLLFIATAVLAVFTTALAIVTVLIWKDGKKVAARQQIAARRASMHSIRSARASERAIEASNASSERQLRAYISIVGVTYDNLTSTSNGDFVAQYRNCGQTPAYGISFWTMLQLIRAEDRIGFAFSEPELRARGSMGECGPGILHSLPRRGPRALTNDELISIHNGTASIFFWGEIIYIDAFAQVRVTRFRNDITGTISDSGRMNVSTEGNSAT